MKRILILWTVILCLCLSLLAGCAGGQEEPAPAGTGTAPSAAVLPTEAEPDPESPYRFADARETAELLLANRDYYDNLTQNDLNFRVQKTGATLEELEVLAAGETRDFTEDEKTLVDEAMAWIAEVCEQQGYRLPSFAGAVFCKTTMREEYNAGAYTHGTQIYLGEALLSYGTSGEQYLLDYFRQIVAHELFHCMTRNNPDFRRDMYGLLGFTVGERELEFAPGIRERIIANPDVEHHDAYAAFEIDGRLRDCVVVFTTVRPFEQPGDDFFTLMATGLVPVDEPGVMYDSGEAANFWDVFGRNTDYVIDPEETLADNFSMLILYGTEGMEYQSPDLIRNIADYLTSR